MDYDVTLDKGETGRSIQNNRFYFFDLNPAEKEPLSIVTTGWEITTKDYNLKREHFPYHTIEYVETGNGIFTLNGTDYPLHPRTVFAYGPNQAQRISTSKDSQLSKFYISIAGPEAESFFQQIARLGTPVISMRDSRYMHELFQQLLDFAARYNFEVGHETCRLVLKLIMKLILNECNTSNQRQSTSYTRFNECIEYMENNVTTLKSVKELAEKVNIHPSYMIRLFNQFDSESPYKRLVRLKAREAAENLMYTDKTIREVADELGFEDPFVFSKCFKRVYGVSPKHFRDNFEQR